MWDAYQTRTILQQKFSFSVQQFSDERREQARALLLGFSAPRQLLRQLTKHFGSAVRRCDFGDHLAVIGRRAEHLRLERNDRDRLVVERLGEIRRLDLGPLRHADLIEAVERAVIVRPRGFQEVEQIFCIAQVGKVGRGDDQDVVGADQRMLGPAGPLMRHVEDDARHGRAQRIEDRLERIGAEVVDAVERRRRRQQAEVIGALRQQSVDEGGVDAVRAKTPRPRCPACGSWLKSRPAVPKARSRSVTTESSIRSRAIENAMLWATVEAPTPPLAPTTAMTRPTGLASGAENSPQIARTTWIVPIGEMR